MTIGGYLSSAELYDPASGTWTTTGSLDYARADHTATLLPDGKVLVAGGMGRSFASAELYDPASGTWTATGSLKSHAVSHTATLLPNGKVLVAGGVQTVATLRARSSTIQPAGPGRSPAASPPHAIITRRRCCPTARCSSQAERQLRLLLASAELYDPASGTWTATGSLATARYFHTATLLPNGKVLVAGGDNTGGWLGSAELYDVGLGFSSHWQPEIAAGTSDSDRPPPPATGSLFQGISQASGGNTQDSSSNYPIVQLRSLDSSQVVFLQEIGRRLVGHTLHFSAG